MAKWMPSCREISWLVSQSFDRSLPLRRRMSMWMHLLMCSHCSRFRKELLAIHRAVRNGAGPTSDGDGGIPDATRDRIKEALREAQSGAEEHAR